MHKLAKIVLATFFTGSSSVAAFGQATDTSALIKAAVLPLPEPLRAGATVFNYEPEGTYTLLRKGSNDMVCIHEPGEGTGRAYQPRDFRGAEGEDICGKRYIRTNIQPEVVTNFVAWLRSLNLHGNVGDPLDWRTNWATKSFMPTSLRNGTVRSTKCCTQTNALSPRSASL
jgi:hypothetical protein